MQLLIATTNPHKIEEIRAIFRIPSLQLVSPKELGISAEIEEDGATFEANATKKAVTLARLSGLWALADDSGLEGGLGDGVLSDVSVHFGTATKTAHQQTNAIAQTASFRSGPPRGLTIVSEMVLCIACLTASNSM